MRRATLLVAALLLLPFALPAGAQPAQGVASGWQTTLRIDTASAQPAKAFEAFDTASLNLFDFNGDGQLEIVSNNDNNHVYVFDSRAGGILAEIETFHHNNSAWPVRELNPVSIGDLYGDGRPCLVVPNSASFLSAWCFDAARSTPQAFHFEKMWEVRVDAAEYQADFWEKHPWMTKGEDHASMDGHAYLADVTGDGKMEVFVETDGYPGQFAFNHDGTHRWSTSWADGNAGAKVTDLNGDGAKEAVFVSDAGIITAYDAATGAIKWNFDSRQHGATPGSIPVFPLLADLHGDGKMEVVFGARQAVETEDPDWINQSHAQYFALNHKGEILWHVSYDWMNPLTYNHPAGVDVNEDGVLDFVSLDWNTIGHNPGDWETTNRPANLFALDGRDGSVLWQKPVTVYWSNKDVVVARVGGVMSVIAPTAKGGPDGLGVYDLKTGELRGWYEFPWQASRGPVAGDLYGDGTLRLVVPIAKKVTDRPNYRTLDVGLREGALLIVSTNEPYDVAFSANFLNTDKEPEPAGTDGTPPVVPPTGQTNVTPPTGQTNVTPPTGGGGGGGGGGTGTPPPTGGDDPSETTARVPGPAPALLLAAAAAAVVLLRRR